MMMIYYDDRDKTHDQRQPQCFCVEKHTISTYALVVVVCKSAFLVFKSHFNQTHLQTYQTHLQTHQTHLQTHQTFKAHNKIANMVIPHQHLIKTKSFILNIIKEGNVVEANQLLELGSKGLVQRSNTQSEIGRIIASDLISHSSLYNLHHT